MAVINFSKTSGVLFVTEGTNQPRSYFGLTGRYVPDNDQTKYQIKIGADEYVVLLSDIRINGVTPSTFSEGKTLLNALFGT